MLLIAMLACGDAAYDVETWNSPLALEAEEPGDAARGEDVFYGEHWEDQSIYALTCAACHAIDSGDTWTTDADDYNRAGHTVWNAPYRETWKVSQTWDSEDSTVIGAYGGQVCVRAYFPSGSNMTGQQAADLEAWMRGMKDDAPGEPTSEPLDFGFTSWDTQDDFIASVQDADGWLVGADLGDVGAGQALATRHCGSCHTSSGDTEPSFFGLASLDTGELIQRIRKVELDGIDAPNDRMPRLPEDRLSDDELRDLLAYLTLPDEG